MQWAFKLHNGRHIIKDTDKTTLAFNNADDARQWHSTFQSVIADLAAKQGVEVRCALKCPALNTLSFTWCVSVTVSVSVIVRGHRTPSWHALPQNPEHHMCLCL